jgi:hypothetical protein
MVVKGNFFNGKLGQDIFTQWEPGEAVSVDFAYSPYDGVTMDDLDNYFINKKYRSEAELKTIRLTILGMGNVAMTKEEIMRIINQGGSFDGDGVGVNDIW